jgi:hypothetical protein
MLRATKRSDVEALQTHVEHRPVLLIEQSAGDVHDAPGGRCRGHCVKRQVIDRAQRQAVDDGGDALRIDIRDEVCAAWTSERSRSAQIAQRWR